MTELPPLVVMDGYDAIQIVGARPDAPSRLLAENARAIADLWNDMPDGPWQRDLVEQACPELASLLWELLGGGPSL